MKQKVLYILIAGLITLTSASCGNKAQTAADSYPTSQTASDLSTADQKLGSTDSSVREKIIHSDTSSPTDQSGPDHAAVKVPGDTLTSDDASAENPVTETPAESISEPVSQGTIDKTPVYLTDDLEFADFSAIHSDSAILYENHMSNSNGITVCVNAGHGTSGGESVRTQCHPDGTPKVTGGSTSEGSTTATAVASGMTFLDGTEERSVTLSAAIILKDRLLDAGYNVLMIRETDDIQLDNIARTVLANNYAQCHIALHWDSTESDKGAYYMKVPSVDSYKNMYPVSETWEKSDQFGECLVQGLGLVGRKIFEEGSLEMDLTQTSYSKVPSIDIELGDRASDHSQETLANIAEGLLMGVNAYFGIGGQG